MNRHATIAFRIRALTVALVVGTALAVGLVVYGGYVQLLDGAQQDALAVFNAPESERLVEALAELQNDAEFLASLPAAQVALDTYLEHGEADVNALDVAATVFASALSAKSHYAQTRLVAADAEGHEVLRFNAVNGRSVRVPEDELQAKGARAYVQEGLAQPPGQVRFSPVTLNRENGQIELPPRPMLRASAVVVGPNGLVGLLLINLDFGALLADRFSTDDQRRRLVIANDAGEYLVAASPNRAFEFEYGRSARIQDDFPVLGPLFDTDTKQVTARLPDQRVVTARRLALFPGEPDRFLAFGHLAAYQEVAGRQADVVSRALWLTLALLVVALAAAVVLSSRLVRPLAEIAQTAVEIEAGRSDARLPVDRTDEIGAMAGALQHMTDALRDQQAELFETNITLEAANADLEHFAHLAAHDLREPARRVLALSNLLTMEAEALDSESADLVRRMSAMAREMLARLRDVQILSGIGETAEPSAIDLSALLADVLTDFDADFAHRKVALNVGPLPTVTGIPRLVASLFRALIENALVHADTDAFELSVFAEGSAVVVRNTGSSIPRDRWADVVKPFVRDADARGAGMGLAIARRIATRHGGRLRVTSTDDAVSVRFTLGGGEEDGD